MWLLLVDGEKRGNPVTESKDQDTASGFGISRADHRLCCCVASTTTRPQKSTPANIPPCLAIDKSNQSTGVASFKERPPALHADL